MSIVTVDYLGREKIAIRASLDWPLHQLLDEAFMIASSDDRLALPTGYSKDHLKLQLADGNDIPSTYWSENLSSWLPHAPFQSRGFRIVLRGHARISPSYDDPVYVSSLSSPPSLFTPSSSRPQLNILSPHLNFQGPRPSYLPRAGAARGEAYPSSGRVDGSGSRLTASREPASPISATKTSKERSSRVKLLLGCIKASWESQRTADMPNHREFEGWANADDVKDRFQRRAGMDLQVTLDYALSKGLVESRVLSASPQLRIVGFRMEPNQSPSPGTSFPAPAVSTDGRG